MYFGKINLQYYCCASTINLSLTNFFPFIIAGILMVFLGINIKRNGSIIYNIVSLIIIGITLFGVGRN